MQIVVLESKTLSFGVKTPAGGSQRGGVGATPPVRRGEVPQVDGNVKLDKNEDLV